MVDAHQNLNGSRELTTPLSWMICHPRLALTTINLPTKFEVSNFTHYEDMKSDTKCRKWGGLGYLGGHSRSVTIAPFDRAHIRVSISVPHS